MADRIITQVIFRKALWICPKCGQEDIEDFNVAGGNTYEHNCSVCGTWSNNFKDYHGCINYLSEDYSKKEQVDIDEDKKKSFDNWVVSIKNPTAHVEPSKEDYEKLYKEKLEEAKKSLEDFAKKSSLSELEILKSETLGNLENISKEVI